MSFLPFLPSRPRIALYGGTFDPIHLGHLLMAEDAYEQLQLDCLVFLPAKVSPDKLTQAPQASAQERLEMLRLALGERLQKKQFVIDPEDLLGEKVSYAVDMAQRWRAFLPDATLFYLMGSDKLSGLDRWKEIDRFLSLVQVVVFPRPTSEDKIEKSISSNHHWQKEQISIRLRGHSCPIIGRTVEISSTEIRQRLAEGRQIDYFLPQSVIDYIQQHHLYHAC